MTVKYPRLFLLTQLVLVNGAFLVGYLISPGATGPEPTPDVNWLGASTSAYSPVESVTVPLNVLSPETHDDGDALDVTADLFWQLPDSKSVNVTDGIVWYTPDGNDVFLCDIMYVGDLFVPTPYGNFTFPEVAPGVWDVPDELIDKLIESGRVFDRTIEGLRRARKGCEQEGEQ